MEDPAIAIHIDVVTQLNERAVAADAAELAAQFGIAGEKAREAFDVAFARSAGRTAGTQSMRAHYKSMQDDAENAGEQAGLGFVGKLLNSVKQGMGAGVSSVREGLESGAMMSEAAEAGGAIGGAFAGAIVLAVGAEMFKVAIEVGEKFEEIEDQVTVHTARAGEALHELQDAATSMVGSLDTNTKSLGTDMAVLATRLHASGEEVKSITGHVEVLRDRWGSLDVNALAGAFAQFGLDAHSADDALAALNEQARQQGVELNTLINDTATYSRLAQELGLSIQQEAHFFSDLEAAHINTGRAAMGLQTAEKALSKENDDRRAKGLPEETLPQFVHRATDAINGLRKAHQDAKAEELEFLVFGTRNWIETGAAAQDYVDTMNALPGAFDAPAAKLDEFKNATQTLQREMQELRNRIEEAFKPVGTEVLDHAKTAVQELIGFLDDHKEAVKAIFEVIGFGLETTINQWQVEIRMIVDGVETMRRLWEVTKDYLGLLGQVVSKFAEWATHLPAVAQMRDVIKEMSGVISAIPSAISGIVNALNGAIPALKPLMDFLERAKSLLDSIPGVTRTVPGTAVPAPGETPYRLPAGTRSWWDMPAPPAPGPYAGMTPEELEPHKGGPKGGKGPRLPEAPEVPFPPGYGVPEIGETARHFRDRMEVMRAQHELATDQARLNQLEHTNTANQDDIQKAKNKIVEDQLKVTEAEARVNEAETTRLRKHSEDLGEIGAKIDKDFGISRGLPGIAENLTKFLANLAFAPVLGALSGVSAATGVGSQMKGVGLLGLGLASAGVGGGLPVPGGAAGGAGGGAAQPVWTGGGWTMPSTNIGSISSPSDIMAGGGRVRALYGLAAALEGTPYSQALRNDCSGMVSKLVNAAIGLPPEASFATPSEGAYLFSHGFQPGIGPPGSLRIGWNPAPGNLGHTAATLPGGESAESGGSSGGFHVGTGPGAFQPQFTQHAWLPMGSYDSGGAVPLADISQPFPYPGYQPGPTPGGPPIDPSQMMPGSPFYPGHPFFPFPPDTQIPSQYWPGYDSGGAVPIIAHGGEWVMQKSAVDHYGAAFMSAVNGMSFDNGGPIIPSPEAPPPPPTPPPAPPPPPAPDHQGTQPSPAAPPGAPATQGTQPQALGGMQQADIAAGLRAGEAGKPGAEQPSRVGGIAAPAGDTQGGKLGIQGGLLGGAISGAIGAGSAAADVFAPGSGAAISAVAQIAMQEINRAIAFGGQLAGIGVEGLMETFLPAGASQLAQSSWLTRIAGGLVGASPVLPNLAGQLGGSGKGSGLPQGTPGGPPGTEGGLTPEQAAAQAGNVSVQGGNTVQGDLNHTVVGNLNYYGDKSVGSVTSDLQDHNATANNSFAALRAR